ncbi:acyltransferase family protein [Deinococcus aquiradiocola]|uniref:Acyltransferase n=1 Tax=Deinococcus aquiradiocola TaxID=393059 RepID=A0A917P5B0_9DEIO|nr:acyltransferase [Deinococcus aquiradiocola]GGJ62310.1 acyltransferase [Deinococcus aquiradiocola]
MKANDLPALNLLRFVAALYIVLFHFDHTFVPPALHGLLSRGPSVTSLFFVLSGFLLMHVYGRRTLDDAGQRRFVGRRLARIVPPNLLGLALFLLIQAGMGSTTVSMNDVLQAGLLIQTWTVGASHILNAPAWSMSCLLFFYLCFPVLAPRLTQLRTRTLAALMTALWLVGAGLPLLLAGLPGVFLPDDWTTYLHNAPLLRLPAFVAGMGLAVLYARHGGIPARWGAVTVLGTLALMVILPQEALRVNNEVFLPLVLLVVLAFANPGRRIGRLGNSRTVRALANASICIYMVHFSVQGWLTQQALPHLGLTWSAWTILAYLLIVVTGSVVADRWLCRPLTRLLTRTASVPPHLPVPASILHPNCSLPTLTTSLAEPIIPETVRSTA